MSGAVHPPSRPPVHRGAWVEPHSGRQIEITSPDTEQVVARVAEADEIDMDRAVAAAGKPLTRGVAMDAAGASVSRR